LISGKLNELISLFVGEFNAPAGGLYQGTIQIQAAARTVFAGLEDTLDAGKDQPPGRTPLSRSGLMEAPVNIPGKIDRRADGTGIHLSILPL
jgi:hypothetical protein